MALESAQKHQELEEVNIGSAKELPPDAYMPVKALNQFSCDWIIKIRVVKKGEVRSWCNDRS